MGEKKETWEMEDESKPISQSKDDVEEERSSESSDEEESNESAVKKAANQKKDYMKKFRELHLKRNQARKLNHEEIEEDRRNKLPANWEARKRKAEWELADQEARKEAEEKGE